MTKEIRSLFIWTGSISCLLLGVFFGAVFYAIAVQEKWIAASTLYGLDLSKNWVLVLAGCYGLIVIFGWIAVYAGRRLPCSECGEPILVKDGFGFRGLACKPVCRVILGRQICSNCLE